MRSSENSSGFAFDQSRIQRRLTGEQSGMVNTDAAPVHGAMAINNQKIRRGNNFLFVRLGVDRPPIAAGGTASRHSDRHQPDEFKHSN